jgi:hypothetical protein
MSALSFHAGIAPDRLLGPYFLAPYVNGAVHHDLLRNVLPELLQEVDLQTGIFSWFMRDGVQPHFLLAVWEFWKNVCPEQWKGSG